MAATTRKVFISYHHADQSEADDFVKTFDEKKQVFISRALGTEMDPTIIDSGDPEYVMRRIRELYLKDSTVTIILIGKCTWARRFVDWELQASLRHGDKTTPNGVLGIVLPSAGKTPTAPDRLKVNLKGKDVDEGYARWHWYTSSATDLGTWIEDAFGARTSRARLIENPVERFKFNKQCP